MRVIGRHPTWCGPIVSAMITAAVATGAADVMAAEVMWTEQSKTESDKIPDNDQGTLNYDLAPTSGNTLHNKTIVSIHRLLRDHPTLLALENEQLALLERSDALGALPDPVVSLGINNISISLSLIHI